jgi:hypothetical protein
MRDDRCAEVGPEREVQRREKKARRFDKEGGPLSPVMRYRTLIDTLKIEEDFLDLADKKARFALIIMSVLNAVAVLLAVRGGDGLIPKTGPWAAAIQLEIVAYAASTVYYLVQAINALRPRGETGIATVDLPTEVVAGESMRVLFHSHIVRRSREDYRRVWDELRLDNVTAELADQLHIVSKINVQKYAALYRLYQGMKILTGIVGLTLLTIGVHRLLE